MTRLQRYVGLVSCSLALTGSYPSRSCHFISSLAQTSLQELLAQEDSRLQTTVARPLGALPCASWISLSCARTCTIAYTYTYTCTNNAYRDTTPIGLSRLSSYVWQFFSCLELVHPLLSKLFSDSCRDCTFSFDHDAEVWRQGWYLDCAEFSATSYI